MLSEAQRPLAYPNWQSLAAAPSGQSKAEREAPSIVERTMLPTAVWGAANSAFSETLLRSASLSMNYFIDHGPVSAGQTSRTISLGNYRYMLTDRHIEPR